jgi:teichuronic acid biosynthesis glycosyltransferase TuaG
MQQGLVSIIIPVYNTEKYLEEAIQSVLLQTYTQWELLIVDDASTDGTLSIAEESQTKDSRIKVLSLVDNGGKAEAINSALPFVKGQYLAFLDGDDIWMPEKLEH